MAVAVTAAASCNTLSTRGSLGSGRTCAPSQRSWEHTTLCTVEEVREVASAAASDAVGGRVVSPEATVALAVAEAAAVVERAVAMEPRPNRRRRRPRQRGVCQHTSERDTRQEAELVSAKPRLV